MFHFGIHNKLHLLIEYNKSCKLINVLIYVCLLITKSVVTFWVATIKQYDWTVPVDTYTTNTSDAMTACYFTKYLFFVKYTKMLLKKLHNL